MKLKLLSIIIICLIFSCHSDQCGNSGNVFGKYINNTDNYAINYIIINKNGTYLQYYKKNGQKEKTNKGNWHLYKQESCKINFDNWKDIVGYIKKDEISHNYAHYRNNKLMFFEDISNAEYEKVKVYSF